MLVEALRLIDLARISSKFASELLKSVLSHSTKASARQTGCSEHGPLENSCLESPLDAYLFIFKTISMCRLVELIKTI